MLIKSILSHNGIQMSARLNQCLYSLRVTPSTVTGVSPMSRILSFPVRTPLSICNPCTEFSTPKNKNIMPKIRNVKTYARPIKQDNIPIYKIGDNVLVNLCHVRGPIKWFPGEIVERIGNVMYMVKISSSGFVKKVHVTQIKANRSCFENPVVRENFVPLWSPTTNNNNKTPISSPKASPGQRTPERILRPVRVRKPPERYSPSRI